ncbi:MAG: class I SAM-dependent methyltransferase [Pseudomonadota bacterium]
MTHRPPDQHFSEPQLAALYDITSPWSEDRDFYLQLAGADRLAILDLGCGTGLVSAAYAAAGHRVVGVDPAAAMLDVARARPHGDEVEWVCAYAQDYVSERRFDLAIMTGHALQALLGDAELAALFAMLARQLKGGGRFVFETRNPARDWASLWNGRRGRFDSPFGVVTISTEVHEATAEFIAFEHTYEFGDRADNQTLRSLSRLRFPSLALLRRLLDAAGFDVSAVYGDWMRGSLSASSEEIVVVAQRHSV